jgi:beta-aspartyl-peptidase (threonine type)
MTTILVHGGAGRWDRERGEPPVTGVRAAAEAGAARLKAGEAALDAAMAAVAALEDDPTFNAGTGASLTVDGRAQLDAAVMAGHSLATGAVAAIERVRHPVAVAHAVMAHTDHCLLTGEGAGRFARALGFADHDPVTEAARRRWQRHRERLGKGDHPALARLPNLLADHPELGGDTVGAVAVDGAGRLAAATSTGGLMLKLPGRVGDSALAGAGFHADSQAAVCATGHGELMIRQGSARAVANRIAAGYHPQAAVTEVLAELSTNLGSEAGLIALDRGGRPGIAHATPEMPYAHWRPDQTTAARLAHPTSPGRG